MTINKTVETAIRNKIEEVFAPSFLRLENESYKHSVPKGSESHFLAVIVSQKFESLNRVKRHQLVYSELKAELETVHAFSMKTLTFDEAAEQGVLHETPDCKG